MQSFLLLEDYRKNSKKPFVIIGLAVSGVILSFIIGILIGHFAIRKSSIQNKPYYNEIISEIENEDGLKMIDSELNADNIRDHLKYLASMGHMAGTPGDKISANYVANHWKSQGLDRVDMIDYNVLLDFPDDNKFNNFEILNSKSELEKRYEVIEPSYDKELNYSVIPKPFLAYAKAGSVASDELIFANYCTEDDFEFLKSIKLTVKDKIVICKYGKLYRGNKLLNAQKYSASGLLLYDDPKRAAPKNASNRVYPNGEFLPPEGTQRGTLYFLTGDVHTPNFPSTDYAYRNRSLESSFLPKIPAQVISYKYAYDLLKLIEPNKNEVKSDWKGDFNLTYTYGGKLSNNRKLKLNVFNKRSVEKTYNVIGIIEGSIEPDRYIILGNHRDSWSFGSIDPSSGTSIMMEISRVLSDLKKSKKWTPKRSIMFISWGAEEYGLIGSYEWVDEFQKKLEANGVVYFNLDTILQGNYSFEAAASPLLFDLVFNVTKLVRLTNMSDETVYDRWLKNNPNEMKNEPNMSPHLGAGSDFTALAQKAGLSCLDATFTINAKDELYTELSYSYATYHSSYETFNLIDKFIDPNFKVSRTVSLITAELLRRCSDSLILPFNARRYSKILNNEYKTFKSKNQVHFSKLNISLAYLEDALKQFDNVTEQFHVRLNSLDKSKYHLIRIYNDQFRNLEKAFLNRQIGIIRNDLDHAIFSPSLFDTYGSDFFPSIQDALYLYKKTPTSIDLIENIKLQLSIVTFVIHSAKSILKDPIDLTR